MKTYQVLYQSEVGAKMTGHFTNIGDRDAAAIHQHATQPSVQEIFIKNTLKIYQSVILVNIWIPKSS